ncbi:MAG: hypothetical protein DRI23_13605, partial [Candidatus Cloacimonadota bacterium]
DGILVEDFTPYVNDPDGDELFLDYYMGEYDESGTGTVFVDINGLEVTFTSEVDWNGSEYIEFEVYDNGGAVSDYSDYDDVNVIVTSVNDAPFVENPLDDFSILMNEENNSIDLNDVFADNDLLYGDNLTFTYSGNSQIGVSIENGIVSLNPAENWLGYENITFTATDDNMASVSDEVQITVATITVTSPNGGDVWVTGWTHTITWTSENVEFVDIEIFYNEGGLSGEGAAGPSDEGGFLVAEEYDASLGSFELEVPPEAEPGEYAIVIYDTYNQDVYDITDGPFFITPPENPLIQISPTTLYATLAPGEVNLQEISIANIGDEYSVLAYSISDTPQGGLNPDIIAWSYLSCTPGTFTAGQTLDWSFSLFNESPEEGAIENVYIEIPSGVIINDATDFLVEGIPEFLIFDPSALADGKLHWYSIGGGFDSINPGNVAEAIVNVTIEPGFEGNLGLNYHLIGDEPGNIMNDIYGTIELYQDWFGLSATEGWVLGGEADYIDVTFDATTLQPGTYTRELFIFSNSEETGGGELLDNMEQMLTFILTVGGPPEIVVDDSWIEETLNTNDSGSQILQISNAGDMNLTVEISTDNAMENVSVKPESSKSRTERNQINGNRSSNDISKNRKEEEFNNLIDELTDEHAIFFDNMENGINGWTTEIMEPTIDDLWHQTTANFNSPSTSWWCGVDELGNY